MGKSIKTINAELKEISKKLEPQVWPENVAWSKHLREGLDAFALEAIDEDLKENASDIKAKLWWLVLQMRLKKMPATALCPSYQDIVRNLSKDDRYCSHLSGFTGIEIAIQLLNKEQLKQAIPILEIAKSHSISANDLNAILFDIYRLEIERAQIRKESKSYISQLENKLRDLEKISNTQKTEGSLSSKGALGIEADNISSKSILEAELNKPKKEIKQQKNNSGKTDKSRIHLLIILVILILTTTSLLIVEKTLIRTPEIIENRIATPIKLDKKNKLDLRLATATIKTNVVDNQYQNISERLESLAEKRKEDAEIREIEEAKRLEESNNNTSNQPVIENITSPIPSSQLEYDIAELPEDQGAEQRELEKNAPVLDPSQLSRIEIQPLDASRKRNRIDLTDQNTDRRDVTSLPYPFPESSARTLDGGEVRAYQVEKYLPAKEFITITRTYVYASPSAVANKKAYLEKDTILTVTRKLEVWLEVKSQSGSIGYVRTQDAVER